MSRPRLLLAVLALYGFGAPRLGFGARLLGRRISWKQSGLVERPKWIFRCPFNQTCIHPKGVYLWTAQCNRVSWRPIMLQLATSCFQSPSNPLILSLISVDPCRAFPLQAQKPRGTAPGACLHPERADASGAELFAASDGAGGGRCGRGGGDSSFTGQDEEKRENKNIKKKNKEKQSAPFEFWKESRLKTSSCDPWPFQVFL